MRSLKTCLTCVLLGLLLPALLPMTGCSGGDELPRLQRVVLIVCDTLSAPHMPAYGHEETKTAYFDSLAASGILFKHCVTPQVWTLTAHMSLFTGLEPGVHRVGADAALAPNVPLLAESLSAGGFTAGGFRTGNGWLDEKFGFDRGFRHYGKYTVNQDLEKAAGTWMDEALAGPDGAVQPGLVFMHFMDVHVRTAELPCPYTPRSHRRLARALGRLPQKHLKVAETMLDSVPKEHWDLPAYDLDFLKKSYDFCIQAWDDTRLRMCIEEVCRSKEMADALIIVTADHGEEFMEHGQFQHNSPHAEVREVPLLILWPGHLPGGIVVEDRVSLIDVLPTLVDLAGQSAPDPCQGVSLRPLLTGRGRFPARDFFIDGNNRGKPLEDSALVGQVDGHWYSLVAMTDTTGCVGTYAPESVAEVKALYDLENDPAETRDVQEQHPQVVAELARRMAARLNENALLAQRLGTELGAPSVELSAEEREQLRALGY